MDVDRPDIERRFGGVRRLYGAAALAKFQSAQIMVIGIGGVGSWAAEALARNAVGRIILVDLDNIAESNVNRQLHAVDGAFGKAKVRAMHERILSINPDCRVAEVEDFITPENLAELLPVTITGVIDCIDDAQAKAALVSYCKQQNIPLVMTGGAGGRLDPTRIQSADMAKVHNDKLLAKVRNLLRRDYGFSKGENTKFGLSCVYSDEPMIKPDAACEADMALSGLNCAGYGSSVCVTAPFGFSAAALMLSKLL